MSIKDRLRDPGRVGSDVEVRACASFDERFDEFWNVLKVRHPNLLLAVRDRETLTWHFKYALLKNRIWIGTVALGSRLAAYAIFERKDPDLRTAPLHRMRLVDFQSLDGTATLLRPIFAWALCRCRKDGIHLLESAGRWLEPGQLIRSLAPHRRKLATWTYFYRANVPALARGLADPKAWAPSLYDGDATL